ncbi:MAG: outer membrane protein assembly factor BamD [Mariprofundaceae bacterium]|nr:outer membrane protein assembly factor BamD [Mariprofundaceae bacterium]
MNYYQMRFFLCFTIAICLSPTSLWASTRASVLYQKALSALQKQQTSTVLSLSQQIQTDFPSSLEAKKSDYLLARAWELNNQATQALQAYRRFLKHHLNTVHRVDAQLKVSLISTALKENKPPVLHLMLAALNQRTLSHDDAAITLLKELLTQYPHSRLADDALNIMAYMQLVDIHDVLGAKQSYQALLKRYPHSNYIDNAMYGLAVALEDNRQWEAARRAYTKLKKKHMSVSMLGLSFAKDNYLSRVWFNKASSRLTHLNEHQTMEQKGSAFIQKYGFMLGIGDRVDVDMPVGSGKNYQALWLRSQQLGLHPQSITHWITHDTDWQWETPDRLKALVQAGYTPIVVDWYFGDQISPSFVSQHAAEYRRHIREQLIPLIRDLPEVWVLLEPEFNKNGIEKWQPWGTLSRDVVDMIHQSVAGSRVGFVLGNWTDTQQSSLIEVMGETVAHSDFVSFQEMISSFDGRSAMDAAWNPVDRSLRLASYLQQAFHKPIYLAYLAISSFGGWEKKQMHMIERFRDAMPELAYHGVIGASYFSLFDDPKHVGWFDEAEKTLGLVSKSGIPKPALSAWKSWDYSRQKNDYTAPYLLQTPRFYGFPLRANTGKLAETYMYSNEWCRWNITIRGVQSKAERVFSGVGNDIHFVWKGLANHGQFMHEKCQIILHADDAAGNHLKQNLLPSCEIISPYPTQIIFRYPLDSEPELYHWGEVISDYHANKGKTALKINFVSPKSGLVLPVDDGDNMDIRQIIKQGMLHLRIRFRSQGNAGLRIGFDDQQGFHSFVLLTAYSNPNLLNIWQDVLIPLHDFPTLANKDIEHQKTLKKPLDWQHIQQILMTSMMTSTLLDVEDIRIID